MWELESVTLCMSNEELSLITLKPKSIHDTQGFLSSCWDLLEFNDDNDVGMNENLYSIEGRKVVKERKSFVLSHCFLLHLQPYSSRLFLSVNLNGEFLHAHSLLSSWGPREYLCVCDLLYEKIIIGISIGRRTTDSSKIRHFPLVLLLMRFSLFQHLLSAEEKMRV